MDYFVLKSHVDDISFAILLCCVLSGVIIIIAFFNRKERSKEMRAFNYFVELTTLSACMDAGVFLCVGNADFAWPMRIMNFISYMTSSLSISFFFEYLLFYYKKKGYNGFYNYLQPVFLIYGLLCSCIYGLSMFTGTFYIIDENAVFILQPLSWVTTIILLPMILLILLLVAGNHKITSKRDYIILLLYSVCVFLSIVLDAFFNLSVHYIIIATFTMLIYILINTENERRMIEQEKELVACELKGLRLQVNPHFIYNTLASIDGLIMTDPEAARILLGKFIKHLRGSYLDDSPLTVPFAKELENLKYYISVEQTRFPGIHVEYDIVAEDFEIPPLTVQPLIENAVKHGICGNESACGTIKIKTRQTDNAYVITIKDDGAGFSEEDINKNDDRSHIGIPNTRTRLKLICSGSLTIESTPGEGTTAKISIPRERK